MRVLACGQVTGHRHVVADQLLAQVRLQTHGTCRPGAMPPRTSASAIDRACTCGAGQADYFCATDARVYVCIAGVATQASKSGAMLTVLFPLRTRQHVLHTTSQHSVTEWGCRWDGAVQRTSQPRLRAASSGVHQGRVAQPAAAQPRRRSALPARRAQDAPAIADRAAAPAEQSGQAANGNGAAHAPGSRNGSHAESRPPPAITGTQHRADRGGDGVAQHDNGSTSQQVEQYGADQTRRRQSWYR